MKNSSGYLAFLVAGVLAIVAFMIYLFTAL